MIGFDDIEHASLTDVGVRRSHNQDNHAILLASDEERWQQQGHLFLVADGMGAHAVGEKASELAASIIPLTYHKHSSNGALIALRKSFIEANASIHARGQQNREFEGMGTTGTALLLRPEGAWVGHVGDSRAYRIRNGKIEQLTFDHSLVWVIARQQRVNPDRIQNIPSNVIVRSLGPEPLVQVDVEGPHPLQSGDIFIICSDGLSGQITDHEMGAVASCLPPAEACRFLVDLANLRGGPDNITLIVVRVGKHTPSSSPELPAAPPPPPPWRKARPVPWPLTTLALGVLLAAGAVVLVAAELPRLGVPAFVLAAVVILTGLVGLAFHVRQESQRADTDDEQEHRPPQIYRSASSQIDRVLVEKVGKATAALKQRAMEQQCEPDWSAQAQHFELAEKARTGGDLIVAFREYCRSMRVITESLGRQRNKEEVFHPVWDKNTQ